MPAMALFLRCIFADDVFLFCGADCSMSADLLLVFSCSFSRVQIGLLSKISLKNNPNLAVLLREGESLADLLKLSPEQLLLRWFNYHLEQAGFGRRVNNFGSDIKVRLLFLAVIKIPNFARTPVRGHTHARACARKHMLCIAGNDCR